MYRFLIDECLSPDLAAVAREEGHDAAHVAHRGWAGSSDPVVVDRMLEGDWTLVTNNGRDFRRLLAGVDLHAGLVVLIPNLRASGQIDLFRAALGFLRDRQDLVNGLLEVYSAEDIRVSNLPPEAV